jgi:hypothetical protein
MSTPIEHLDIPLEERHAPHNWEYADATAREAATGFVPADIGRQALQLDDFSRWTLIDDDPATWQSDTAVMVGDSGSGGAAGLVPAPGAGDAAAGKFLKADGTFAVPSGTGAETGANSDITSMDGLTGALEIVTRIDFAEGAAPSTPGTGEVSLYAKADGKLYIKDDAGTETDLTAASISGSPFELVVACSDETTALTTGTAKIIFRMPRGVTLSAVRASLSTAQTSGSIFTVDINEGGSSILSTKLTIDNGEKTSTTAATPPVISDSSLADDAEMTVDIDQVGDGTAKGLKVTLIGTRA